MEYELLYLVGESKEADLEQIKKEVEEIVTQGGGVFQGLEVVEKRKLAYKVEHDIKGTYVARRFVISKSDEDEVKDDQIASINKKLNLYVNILRSIIVRADDLPELKKREIPVHGKTRTERNTRTREVKEVREPRKEEKAAVPTQDIDKKLEEILNI